MFWQTNAYVFAFVTLAVANVSADMTIRYAFWKESLYFERQLYVLFLHPWKLNIHIYLDICTTYLTIITTNCLSGYPNFTRKRIVHFADNVKIKHQKW